MKILKTLRRFIWLNCLLILCSPLLSQNIVNIQSLQDTTKYLSQFDRRTISHDPSSGYQLSISYVANKLQAMGYTMEFQPVVRSVPTIDYISDFGYNIIAKRSGRQNNKYIVFGAHLDAPPCNQDPLYGKWGTRIASPGACDNAAGVAAVVEIARLLYNNVDLEYGVAFCLWCGHEYYPGFGAGSLTWLESMMASGLRIRLGMDFDWIGRRDPSGQLATELAFEDAESQYLSSLVTPKNPGEVVRYFPQLFTSDHNSYQYYGFQAVGFLGAWSTDQSDHHSHTDTEDKIDYVNIQNIINHSLDLFKTINKEIRYDLWDGFDNHTTFSFGELIGDQFTPFTGTSNSGPFVMKNNGAIAYPFVGKNTSNEVQYISEVRLLQSNYIYFHPGVSSRAALRWVCPTAGSYAFNCTIESPDLSDYRTTSDICIKKNAQVVWQTGLNLGAAQWDWQSGTLIMNAGDIVELSIGNGENGYYYDTTGVQFSITKIQ